MPERQYWLVKSEPSVFSFDDLQASPRKTTRWDGVRNYAARNHLRAMQKGDLVFFYHSSSVPAAIVGIAEVARESYPDPTALDSSDAQFDPKSDPANPTWFAVDLRAVEPMARPVALDELKKDTRLAGMALIRIGRLSVQPVTAAEYVLICKLATTPGGKKKG